MNLTLINFIAFQISWLACILGAAQGIPLIGPTVVAMFLALHLFLTPNATRELRLLLIAGAIGFVIDTLQAALGVFSFSGNGIFSWVSPPWMVALWLNLATALHTSLSWLTGRYIVAAILGAVTGPLSYYAGARLGALTFNPNPVASLAVLALVWGIAMPGLVRLAK